MTSERWQRVDEIFQAAIELKAEERFAFVESACADDDELRREVESLITADKQGLSVVDEPAFQVAAGLLGTDEPVLADGQSIGHFEIVELIGRGGMGEVYLAKDLLLNRRAALKLLPAEYTKNQDRLRRFQQEAQAASALNHPNILTIYELGQVNGQQFIATEFIEGETLRQRLKRAPLNLPETIDITVQIGSALATAHHAGIVHRDIKPENIMLRRDGYVKVLDFGLAKLVGQDELVKISGADEKSDISSGLIMGTVKYMSPEQAQGRAVDQRSDIFSFGVVLYEMLAGHTPFEGETASERLAAIKKKEPPPLTDVPDEMQRIVCKALCKKKEERYQTIEEIIIALKRLREDKAFLSVAAQVAPQTVNGSALATSDAAASPTSSTIESIITGIKQHKTATVFILASLALVSISLTYGLNRLGKLHAPSKGRIITRIPSTDRAVHVAISPKGDYIVYTELSGSAVSPTAPQSLWVQEVATGNRTEIVTTARTNYDGLTFSPDGRDIFYVSNDVLYRIPASGGEVTKVLSGVIGRISFAPDGTQFAFLKGLNSEEMALSVANADGSGERLLATRKMPLFFVGPAWSPDGTLIACWSVVVAQDRSMGMVGFDAITGEEKKITDHQWKEVIGPAVWLPDGTGLIASAMRGTENQIWQIPYPSGEAHRISDDPNYGYDELSLTGDGKNLIALQGAWRSSLWLVPAGDSSQAKPISFGEHEDYGHVAWTPDGRILYVSSVGTSPDIWVMNSDGTNPKQLTANTGIQLQAKASPDGRVIVFSSNRADGGAFNIWRMDSDGSNSVQLTHGDGEVQPVCSPDGRWVVYSQGAPNTTPWMKTLWKVPINGGEPVQLCDKPSSGAAISPDGTLIACWYAENPEPPMKLAIIPFAGGPPIKIFDVTQTKLGVLRWTLDGQAISYINHRQGVSNIWSQPIDGGLPKQITQFTSEQIGGFDWSRDGTLVCSRGHRVHEIVLISDFR